MIWKIPAGFNKFPCNLHFPILSKKLNPILKTFVNNGSGVNWEFRENKNKY